MPGDDPWTSVTVPPAQRDEIRRRVAAEFARWLDELRAGETGSEAERRALLARLWSWFHRAVGELDSAGALMRTVSSVLRPHAPAPTVGPGPIDQEWQRALDSMEFLRRNTPALAGRPDIGGGPAATQPPPATPRRPFWKRG